MIKWFVKVTLLQKYILSKMKFKVFKILYMQFYITVFGYILESTHGVRKEKVVIFFKSEIAFAN